MEVMRSTYSYARKVFDRDSASEEAQKLQTWSEDHQSPEELLSWRFSRLAIAMEIV
jgi:hypothetical protein